MEYLSCETLRELPAFAKTGELLPATVSVIEPRKVLAKEASHSSANPSLWASNATHAVIIGSREFHDARFELKGRSRTARQSGARPSPKNGPASTTFANCGCRGKPGCAARYFHSFFLRPA
jgi:hypothetical protein